jgi:deoxyribonuclease-4
VGAHVGNIEEIKLAKDSGATIVQLFVSGIKIKDERNDLLKLKQTLDYHDLQVVVHASYNINLAKTWDTYSWWIAQFIIEIEHAAYLGARIIVVHLGKKLDLTLEEAYNNMYTSLLYVHEETKQYSNLKIVLETSTGQGSEICFRLEEFAHFFKKLSKHPNKNIKSRFGICVDTCHIFVAGYDIRTKENVEIFLDSFEELIGINHIKLIHLNDSKNDIGSMLDRHESINQGLIKKKGLLSIIKYFKKYNIPIVLETPNNSFVSEIKKYLL